MDYHIREEQSGIGQPYNVVSHKYMRRGLWYTGKRYNGQFDTRFKDDSLKTQPLYTWASNNRHTVYACEDAIYHGEFFYNLNDISHFLGQLMTSHWFRQQFLLDRIVIHPRPMDEETNAASAVGNQIWLPDWSHNQLIILHELAHVLCKGEQGHGEEFTSIYLQLVRYVLGPHEARELRMNFKNHSVKFWE